MADLEEKVKTATETEQKIIKEASKTESAEHDDFVAVVNENYRVFLHLPLPLLDLPNAKAYQAEDVNSPDRRIFAYVCRPDLPVRKDHVRLRAGSKVEGLLPLVASGVAYWKPLQQRTFFLIYERPLGGRVVMGKKFAPVLSKEEVDLVSKWVRPLLMGINNLATRGLTHRAIRPDNLFYMDSEKTQIVLGDCISVPPAYDQPGVCETIPSMLCQPAGRGNGVTADDLYALGATLMWLGLGHNPVEGLSMSELAELKVRKGSYATIIGEERIALALIELLRGLLSDSLEQRWDISSVQQWIDGRRLTPVQVRAGKTSQRPFIFNNQEHFSYRSLALAFFYNWDLAAEAIRSERLMTWILRGFEDKQTAEAIAKTLEMAIFAFSQKERQDDFIVSRTCMLLHPETPLHLRDWSFMPDALGYVLAVTVLQDRDVKPLIGIITTGFLESWYSLKNDRVAAQQVKAMQVTLKKPDLGMGIERVLYETAEGVPCQSPLVKKYYVDNVRDLTAALEQASKKVDARADPVDRHIAAFISVNFGTKLGEQIALLNSPKENVAAQGMLSLYSTLQWTFGPDKLYGMCSWLGRHIIPIINNYHNLEKRKQLEKELPKYIRKGSLPELYRFLDDKEERLSDMRNFEQARRDYAKISKEIETLDGNREKRVEHGMMLGYEVAAIVSFSIALLVMLLLLVARFLRG